MLELIKRCVIDDTGEYCEQLLMLTAVLFCVFVGFCMPVANDLQR